MHSNTVEHLACPLASFANIYKLKHGHGSVWRSLVRIAVPYGDPVTPSHTAMALPACQAAVHSGHDHGP